MISVGQVAAPLAWSGWSDARAMLDPAIVCGDEPWLAIEGELATGAMQLVGVLDDGAMRAAVLVRTARTQRGDVLEVAYCGGEGAASWAVPGINALKAAAADARMIGVRVFGRPGWERLLAPAGMRRRSIILETF